MLWPQSGAFFPKLVEILDFHAVFTKVAETLVIIVFSEFSACARSYVEAQQSDLTLPYTRAPRAEREEFSSILLATSLRTLLKPW